MADIPAVAIREVDFAYDGRLVLEGVTCTIAARDFVAIVGPNGGGKTTLLRLMLGLLRPGRGEVRIFGEPPGRASQRVGYVPQQFTYDPSFPVTVSDVVQMGSLGGIGARTARAIPVSLALGRVGLGGLERRPFHDLSGGQRQRLLIARALLAGTDMLLLDEPTAYVDLHGENDVHALLRELNQTMTVVVVTHDLGFVSQAVNTVLCVNQHVTTHPTLGIADVTAELLQEMYGSDIRVVRHDATCLPGECPD
jgi:zinc transport system ATP-binding protein